MVDPGHARSYGFLAAPAMMSLSDIDSGRNFGNSDALVFGKYALAQRAISAPMATRGNKQAMDCQLDTPPTTLQASAALDFADFERLKAASKTKPGPATSVPERISGAAVQAPGAPVRAAFSPSAWKTFGQSTGSESPLSAHTSPPVSTRASENEITFQLDHISPTRAAERHERQERQADVRVGSPYEDHNIDISEEGPEDQSESASLTEASEHHYLVKPGSELGSGSFSASQQRPKPKKTFMKKAFMLVKKMNLSYDEVFAAPETTPAKTPHTSTSIGDSASSIGRSSMHSTESARKTPPPRPPRPPGKPPKPAKTSAPSPKLLPTASLYSGSNGPNSGMSDFAFDSSNMRESSISYHSEAIPKHSPRITEVEISAFILEQIGTDLLPRDTNAAALAFIEAGNAPTTASMGSAAVTTSMAPSGRPYTPPDLSPSPSLTPPESIATVSAPYRHTIPRVASHPMHQPGRNPNVRQPTVKNDFIQRFKRLTEAEAVRPPESEEDEEDDDDDEEDDDDTEDEERREDFQHELRMRQQGLVPPTSISRPGSLGRAPGDLHLAAYGYPDYGAP